MSKHNIDKYGVGKNGTNLTNANTYWLPTKQLVIKPEYLNEITPLLNSLLLVYYKSGIKGANKPNRFDGFKKVIEHFENPTTGSMWFSRLANFIYQNKNNVRDFFTKDNDTRKKYNVFNTFNHVMNNTLREIDEWTKANDEENEPEYFKNSYRTAQYTSIPNKSYRIIKSAINNNTLDSLPEQLMKTLLVGESNKRNPEKFKLTNKRDVDDILKLTFGDSEQGQATINKITSPLKTYRGVYITINKPDATITDDEIHEYVDRKHDIRLRKGLKIVPDDMITEADKGEVEEVHSDTESTPESFNAEFIEEETESLSDAKDENLNEIKEEMPGKRKKQHKNKHKNANVQENKEPKPPANSVSTSYGDSEAEDITMPRRETPIETAITEFTQATPNERDKEFKESIEKEYKRKSEKHKLDARTEVEKVGEGLVNNNNLIHKLTPTTQPSEAEESHLKFYIDQLLHDEHSPASFRDTLTEIKNKDEHINRLAGINEAFNLKHTLTELQYMTLDEIKAEIKNNDDTVTDADIESVKPIKVSDVYNDTLRNMALKMHKYYSSLSDDVINNIGGVNRAALYRAMKEQKRLAKESAIKNLLNRSFNKKASNNVYNPKTADKANPDKAPPPKPYLAKLVARKANIITRAQTGIRRKTYLPAAISPDSV